MNVEEPLLKSINKANSSNELKVLESSFRGNFERNRLESELQLIPAIFKQSTPVDFWKICKTFQDMDEEKRPMIKNIWAIIQIVLISGVTSATPECFFSMQRRIKTWLR